MADLQTLLNKFLSGLMAGRPTFPAGGGTATAGTNGTLSTWIGSAGNVGAGEDILRSYTLPGNTLNADGDALRIKAWGQTGATANTKTIKFYFGATAVQLYGSTGSSAHFEVNISVVRTGAATQHYKGISIVTGSVATNASTTAAETLSGDIVLSFTGESSGAADNDVLLYGFEVEIRKVPTAT
jgi:hypothetical protein